MRGSHLNLHNWRADHWTPAVRAAGLAHRPPYALRNTFASFSIAAGVSLFELARFMGTSVGQIDQTHGHLLPDSLDRMRSTLNAFIKAPTWRRKARPPNQPSSAWVHRAFLFRMTQLFTVRATCWSSAADRL